MLLRQLLDRESCTFTYLIAEGYGKSAAIIDPVLENIDLYKQLLDELDLTLEYTIETHTHADHITASGHLAQQLGCRMVVGAPSLATPVDLKVKDGDTLTLDSLTITAIATPGHTDDSYSFFVNGCLFTGDILLIRGTGRTDFQSGNPYAEYESITQKLFVYPDDTIVYPAHDYKIMTKSTIGEEKRFNPRLRVSNADEYADLMKHLNLPHPNRMKEAVPANLKCGLEEKP